MERSEISQQIALLIRIRLRQLRLTQMEFAKMAEASNSEVSKWLTGRHNFTIKTLEHIQTILGISFFSFKVDSAPCLPCEFTIINTKQ